MLLNAVFLKNRMTELGLKQWWLAEQIGVDRKTVTRWVQGHVRTLLPENLKALALILKCRPDDLVIRNENEVLATADDQMAAARLLASSSLIDRLGPIGEWNVIESLLKATIVKALPLEVLGGLYNQLTVASWRQSKLDQAEVYNRKALEIAAKCGDKEVLAKAKLSEANLASWSGKSQKAILLYREILKLSDFIDRRTIGSTHSNLGAVLYEIGEGAEGHEQLLSALEIFVVHGRPMNLSIVYGHLANLAIQEMKLERAEIDCEKSIEFAKVDEYFRGIAFGHLLQAEIFALQKKKAEALAQLNESLTRYADLKIEEGLNYEKAGRVHRLLRDFDRSEALYLKGLAISDRFPLSLASLNFELAILLREQGKDFVTRAQDAQRFFMLAEAPRKAQYVADWLKS